MVSGDSLLPSNPPIVFFPQSVAEDWRTAEEHQSESSQRQFEGDLAAAGCVQFIDRALELPSGYLT